MENNGDIRQTINQLQFNIRSGNLGSIPRPLPSEILTVTDPHTNLIEKGTLLTCVQNADFSNLVDFPARPTTWRAIEYGDLNFVPKFTLDELPPIGYEVS